MASTVLPKLIGDIVAAGAFGTFCAIDGMFENNGNGVSSHRFTYNDTLITRNSDNKITINKSGILNLICMSAATTAFDGGSGRFTIKLNDVALSVTEYDYTNLYCRYTTEVVAGDILNIIGNDAAYTDEAGYAVTFLDCPSGTMTSGASDADDTELVGVIVYADEHYRYTGGVTAYLCNSDLCAVSAPGGNVSDSNSSRTATLGLLKDGKYRIKKRGQGTTAVTVTFPGHAGLVQYMANEYVVSLDKGATISATFKPVVNTTATSYVCTGTIIVERLSAEDGDSGTSAWTGIGTGASWCTRHPDASNISGPTVQDDGNYIYPCMTAFGDAVSDDGFYATLPAGVYRVAGMGLGLDYGKYHIAKKGALGVSLCGPDYAYSNATNVFSGKQTFTLSEDSAVAFVSLAGYSEGAVAMVTRVE